MLTKYLAGDPRDLTYSTIYSIWALSAFTPRLATFDEETLNAVSAAPHFPISPCVVAVLKSNILGAATELPPDQFHALMDRLQILPSADHTERLNGCTFMILIEFLEQLGPSAIAKFGPLDTLNFLVKRCPREPAPKSFQQRFAARLWDGANRVSMDSGLVDALIEWLFDASSESFNDVGARRAIGEAFENYSTNLSDDQIWQRQQINIVTARLRSPPDIVIDDNALVTVSGGSHSESDTSSQSSHEGDPYHTPFVSVESGFQA